MDMDQKDIGRGFMVWWVLASALGFGGGAILGMAAAISANMDGSIAFALVEGAVFGLLGGSAQWLVLRTRFDGVNLWVPATVLGCMVAPAIAAGASQQGASDFAAAVIFIAFLGLAQSLPQWLVLRKHGVSLIWWLGANLVGSLMGFGLGFPAIMALGSGERYPGNVFLGILFGFGLALGIGLGLPTGGGLTWLLRNPKTGSGAGAARQAAR